jgi:hypothetical protein
MTTAINVKITRQGLLIPLAAIHEWLEGGDLEVIKESQRIIIQPKPAPALTERAQVLQILEKAGLIVPPEHLPPAHKPVSPEEQMELARKFSIGRPLSELILKERQAGW